MPEPRSYRQHRFAPPPGATDILLVRHGESMPVVEGRPIPHTDGHDDPDLSPEGRDQAARVCARLAHEPLDAIYTTSLRRTHQTAAALVASTGLTPTVEPDLREVFLGDWEGGLFRKLVTERHPTAVRMFTEERWDVIPGAEPDEQFSARVRGAIGRIAAAHPDQRVAVFAHGGTIGKVLSLACGSSGFAFVGSDNASISQVVVTADRWIVRRFNDTNHLQGLDPHQDPLAH